MKNKHYASIQRLLISIFVLVISMGDTSASTPNRTYANNSAVWFMYFGTYRIEKNISLHAEVQWRRVEYVESPQQLLLRAGINYHLRPNLLLTGGYCFAETYPYGKFAVKTAFPENRVWEQLQLKTAVGKIEWINRLRLEQRFNRLPVLSDDSTYFRVGENVYTNRFRIMNKFSLPFSGKEILDRKLYVTLIQELFINFGKNVGFNYFDQNRATLALGYVIPKVGRLELGFMEQNLFKTDGVRIENNHTLQLGLTSTLDFRKTKD